MAFVVFFIQHIMVAVEWPLVELIFSSSQVPLSSWHERHHRTGRLVEAAFTLSCSEWHFDKKNFVVKSCTADSNLLRQTGKRTAHLTRHSFSCFRLINTHTRDSWVCRVHITCHDSCPCAHVCVVIDFLRLLHFLLFVVDLLSNLPFHSLGLLHDVGDKVPCALSRVRTSTHFCRVRPLTKATQTRKFRLHKKDCQDVVPVRGEIFTLPIDQCHSHLIQFLEDCSTFFWGMSCRKNGPPSVWDTNSTSGNVFANPVASSSALNRQKSNPRISDVSEHTSSHAKLSARNSVILSGEIFQRMMGQTNNDCRFPTFISTKFHTRATFVCWKIQNWGL